MESIVIDFHRARAAIAAFGSVKAGMAICAIVVTHDETRAKLAIGAEAARRGHAVTDERIVFNKEKFAGAEPRIISPCAMPGLFSAIGGHINKEALPVTCGSNDVVIGYAIDPSASPDFPISRAG